MSLFEDLNAMSSEDIQLILDDQKDLYTSDELKLLQEELIRRNQITLEKKRSLVPNVISCVKCNGPVSSSSEACDYCGCAIDIDEIATLPWEIYNNKEQSSTENLLMAKDKFSKYGMDNVASEIEEIIESRNTDYNKSNPSTPYLIWSIICGFIGGISISISSYYQRKTEYQIAQGVYSLFGFKDISEDVYYFIQVIDWIYQIGIALLLLSGILFIIFIAKYLTHHNTTSPTNQNVQVSVSSTFNGNTTQKRFCSYCGNMISANDIYCWKCGSKL